MAGTILIPAYEPDATLVDIVRELADYGEQSGIIDRVVVIDDGTSSQAGKATIAESELAGAEVIHHPENAGKGAAIRSGIGNARQAGADFVVTADADGQHLVDDIVRVVEHTAAKQRFTVGYRVFDEGVPLRSRFGNAVTSALFRLMLRSSIKDTQSGLRGYPASTFETLLGITSERYEFELDALLTLGRSGEIEQIPITTVYEPGNPSSHFRPLMDSARIYFVFLRHTIVALLCWLFDFVAFMLVALFLPMSTAFVVVRPIAAVVYFFAMRRVVYHSHGSIPVEFAKYLLLALVNVLIATSVIDAMMPSGKTSALVFYVVTTTLMFFVNFLVQRYLIFRG